MTVGPIWRFLVSPQAVLERNSHPEVAREAEGTDHLGRMNLLVAPYFGRRPPHGDPLMNGLIRLAESRLSHWW